MDIESISEKYQLSTNETNVLKYLNQNKDKSNLNIREVAKATYTSPASIIAMCKKMGLSGYSELIYYLVRAKNLTFSLHQNDVIKQYGAEFSSLIYKHRNDNFMIISAGLSNNIAKYMSDYFNLHNFRATTNGYLEYLRPDWKNKTLLFIVSNSGETRSIVELLEMANQNKIDNIVFTGDSASILAKNAKLSISSDTHSAYSYQEYYPQLFFGTTLNTFELLMSHTLTNWE
ncbi:MurR/RpiR family transcriptional regulator [Xylocopilactobacillus apicola]|uniref:RpiR family transcriptional regulator n=1 Tax=Xylocopilactobacillus apicola TaxID=2932184 RepID=A0AAU9CUS0_9LACO|nr:SIS domain-containing protein [Xylocopilactobacillus apicola]BDR57749.1 RpiR family transcriptional regulator [Xylocopilactobacillus apicola]